MKMRSLLIALLLAATILTGGKAEAQEKKFGAKGGLNLSNLSLEDNDDSNLRTGFHVGVWAGFPIATNLSIQPELQYSSDGTRWLQETSEYTADASLKLDYIELPVNLVYHLSRDVDFQVGPYVAFLASASSESTLKTGSSSLNLISDLDKDNFKSTDFGLQAGMRFYLKPIYIGFGYKLGLTEVANDNARNYFGDAANRSIRLSVGYAF